MQIQKIERVLLMTGLVLLAIWTAARFHRAVSSRAAIKEFLADQETKSADIALTLPFAQDPLAGSNIDFRLWSIKRISAYQESIAKKIDPAIAILRIPKIALEVPVFNDTDDLTLNRGVGRILGTAQIGQPGNLGIAGHRDGFFRGLQSIGQGDVIEVVRPGGIDRFVVDKIQIVTPEDTHVLDPTPTPTLTLVTCFPFYFVGHAPKRYIVTALLESPTKQVSALN